MQNRISKVKKLLIEKGLTGIIVTNPVNIFYLAGFRGVSPQEREAILIVTSTGATLITARLYQAEALKLASPSLMIKIADPRNEINEFIKDSLTHAKTVGFEEHDLKFSEFKEFKKILNETGQYSSSRRQEVSLKTDSRHPRPSVIPAKAGIGINSSEDQILNQVFDRESQTESVQDDSGKFSPPSGGSNNSRPIRHKLIPIKHLVEDLRIIKSADEIKNIERAQLISQKAFEQIIKTIKIGQTEAEIAEKLAQIIKSLGAPSLAFDSIVASGPNSAKPHHVTSNRRLAINDTLLLDFGAKYKDYCADLSRTIFIGKATDQYRNIYIHVEKAQKLAIAKIKANAKASTTFKAAHDYFKNHKLDSYFLHSLGHGIGLEVHERPSVSKKSKDTLAEGMVFSVEPGLYFPAWGGVRIEDLVVIKNSKANILGKSSQFVEIKI